MELGFCLGVVLYSRTCGEVRMESCALGARLAKALRDTVANSVGLFAQPLTKWATLALDGAITAPGILGRI
jgi:hypothetical protein